MHSDSRGFTIIELMIVVVIIGILAAISIPKFVNTKEKAYLASMKADLRNLVTAEEAYIAEFYTYSSNLGTTYQTSAGVTVTLQNVSASGWAATAAHNGTAKGCAIFYGTVGAPPAPATQEGEPACN
jgi:prepilin-type N-terminal cleavage/methylation domain-containing protein